MLPPLSLPPLLLGVAQLLLQVASGRVEGLQRRTPEAQRRWLEPAKRSGAVQGSSEGGSKKGDRGRRQQEKERGGPGQADAHCLGRPPKLEKAEDSSKAWGQWPESSNIQLSCSERVGCTTGWAAAE